MANDTQLVPGRARKHRRTQGVKRVLVQLLSATCMLVTLTTVLGSTVMHWSYQDPCESAFSTDSQALFDYMSFYACSELLPQPMKVVLLLLWLTLLISLLASTADDFFVPQLEALSTRLGLREDVAGVTLLALGNGMPDVMTAQSSVNKANDLALTMGEFLGAANFIVILVLGFVLLSRPGPTTVDAVPFLRDSTAYCCVVLFMVGVTWDGTVNKVESVAFFVIYFVYVALVVLPSRIKSCSARTITVHGSSKVEMSSMQSTAERSELFDDPDEEDASPSNDFQMLASESEAETPEELDAMHLAGLHASAVDGAWALMQLAAEFPFTLARHVSIPSADWNGTRRLMAAVCPLCGTILMLLSFGGWEAFQGGDDGTPKWVFCLVPGLLAAVVIVIGSSPTKQPRWHLILLLWAMASAVSWFNLLANECVAVLETFGLNLGISSSVLGITVLAWGNSVGDLVADTALVKQGRSRMAIAGVFGSPLLSDLLGLGLALTSYTWQHGELPAKLSKQNRIAAVTLTVSLASTIAIFVVCRFSCPRCFGVVLLAEYGLFMILSVACELSLVPDVPAFF